MLGIRNEILFIIIAIHRPMGITDIGMKTCMDDLFDKSNDERSACEMEKKLIACLKMIKTNKHKLCHCIHSYKCMLVSVCD